MENLKDLLSKKNLNFFYSFVVIFKFIKQLFYTDRKKIIIFFSIIASSQIVVKFYLALIDFSDIFILPLFLLTLLMIFFFPYFFPLCFKHLVDRLRDEKVIKNRTALLRIFVINTILTCLIVFLVIIRVFLSRFFSFSLDISLISRLIMIFFIIFNLFYGFVLPSYYTKILSLSDSFKFNKKSGYRNRLKVVFVLLILFVSGEIITSFSASISKVINYTFYFYFIETIISIFCQTMFYSIYLSSLSIFFVNTECMLEKNEKSEIIYN